MSQPSLYLTLLHRNLGEGHSWVEASDRALAGVSHAYDLVKQAVLGPPALRSSNGAAASTGGRIADDAELIEYAYGEVDDDGTDDETELDDPNVIDAETVDDVSSRAAGA